MLPLEQSSGIRGLGKRERMDVDLGILLPGGLFENLRQERIDTGVGNDQTVSPARTEATSPITSRLPGVKVRVRTRVSG